MTKFKRSRKLRLSIVLMMLTILLVAAFQGYWIKKLYAEAWQNLKTESTTMFREVAGQLLAQSFRTDTATATTIPAHPFLYDVLDSVKRVHRTSAARATYYVGNTGYGVVYPDVHDSVGGALHLGIGAATATPHTSTMRMATEPPLKAATTSAVTPHSGTGIAMATPHAGTTTAHKSTGTGTSVPTVTIRGYESSVAAGSKVPVMIEYFSPADSTGAAYSLPMLDSAFKKKLLKSNITIPFTLSRLTGQWSSLKPIPSDMLAAWSYNSNYRDSIYTDQVKFGSPATYILAKLKLPIGLSLMLLAFTTASFIFLYRNLVQQQRIAEIRNEFVSNMTHELKTPISTVKVAVEALRHFGALDDPRRTREYLDISALELQRLSLLVDKVLKLSMFENRQIQLNPERLDLHQLTAEVMASMKLQFEKTGATVQLTATGGSFPVKADRMHLSSVLSNLFDNALKYSREQPNLAVCLSQSQEQVILSVSDNGIGIPAAYQDKIFDKFFRVPSGDHHNIKGYGLGLSYVHHIITQHNGQITVSSKEGKGSTFTIQLPAA